VGKDSAVGGLIAFIVGVVGVVAVLKIIDDATKEKKYVCPNCGYVLRKGISKCPQCQTLLRWA
jgi:lipopolysaccharide biosynthesis regulator YciM